MAKINTLIALPERKGVLLTLGITFLALVVLSLATIILRNAETSEDRLAELAGMDRLYNLGSSTERAMAQSLYPLTGINLTTTNDTISIGRHMYPWPDNTLSTVTSNIFDYNVITLVVLRDYLHSVTRGVTNFKDFNFGLNTIILNFAPSGNAYWLTTFPINISDFPHSNLRINNGTENSTFHLMYLSGLEEEFTFTVKHASRNGLINWSEPHGRRETGGPSPVKITVRVEGPNSWTQTDFEDDAAINNTVSSFPQVIYIDNLTGDQGTEYHLEKPSIRFFTGSSGGQLNLTGNLFVAFNFKTELDMDFIVRLNTSYTEARTLQLITTTLQEFNMSRAQFARYA